MSGLNIDGMFVNLTVITFKSNVCMCVIVHLVALKCNVVISIF